MKIDLDAAARTSDGHAVGKVRRVIIDPETDRITGFVVGTGGLLGRDVIVDERDFAESSAPGEVALRLDKATLEQQPDFDEGSYVPPPQALAASMGYGYPSNAYLVPIVPIVPMDQSDDQAVPEPSRPTIKRGDVVKDRDGDDVGVIEEVRFDRETGALTGFVVRPGAGIERLIGGGETAEISRDEILRIVEGEVRIAIDREEIAPPRGDAGARR